MAKEVLKLYGSNSGKTVTTTINDVNPDATNLQLATLGTMFNALTTDTYEKTDKVTTVNCDTEPDGSKQIPTLTLSKNQITASSLNEVGGGNPAQQVQATTNSNGHLYVRFGNSLSSYSKYPVVLPQGTTEGLFLFYKIPSGTVSAQTVYIGVTETDTYSGIEATVNITT